MTARIAEPTVEEVWHSLLDGQLGWQKARRLYSLFPARKRCKNCNAPFDGIGALYARLTGRAAFSHNPRFCEF